MLPHLRSFFFLYPLFLSILADNMKIHGDYVIEFSKG